MIKTNLLFHLRAIQRCLPRFQAVANLNVADFRLEIKGRNRWYVLLPQFLVKRGQNSEYSPYLVDNTTGFIGWLPYFNRQWPIATGKLEFKNYCIENGLLTPPMWFEAHEVTSDFLIKKNRSAFGAGIRGPFRRDAALTPECMRLDDAEFYEAFIAGDIGKIWYWNERPVCLERFPMPHLMGDGRKTVRQLIAEKTPASGPLAPEWGKFEALAAYHGGTLDTPVPDGETLIGDFRYITPLRPKTLKNQNVLAQYLNTEVERQLTAAGLLFAQAIPEKIRSGTLFTIDVIIDNQDRVWFLEANCNPMGHPDIYPPMLETLLGAEEDRSPTEGISANSVPAVIAANA